MEKLRFVRWFAEIGMDDVGSVGGKNASLGEMFQNLAPQGIRVPNGFAMTADAYFQLLQANGLDKKIQDFLAGLDTQNIEILRERGKKIRQYFLDTKIPDEVQREILLAYQKLGNTSGVPMDVAVRSSATAEDLPDASFAGQQKAYLNAQGEQDSTQFNLSRIWRSRVCFSTKAVMNIKRYLGYCVGVPLAAFVVTVCSSSLPGKSLLIEVRESLRGKHE